ncbi:hsp90 co-chaperone Cdc37-like [Lineus longissimus]|uniref:hsp90 co-chaperone Cdc37-like n=1 Tax=Lineus longissimus TaxID=88925 RepID=UPI002B4D7105
MSRLDYSKWDNIEVSDDEDDTHPNIDTGSLFRWRHQARVERMDERKKKREEFETGYQDHQRKFNANKKKLAESDVPTEQLEKLTLEKEKLLEQEAEWRKKEAELEREERMAPQNVDTLCHEGKSRTIINKPKEFRKSDLTEEEKATKLQDFVKQHKKEIEKYGMMRKYEDSQDYLMANTHLTCDETANHLVIWCINLEMEQKHDLMTHVAHQTIVMQFILQLAESMNVDPRDCVRPFFSRIKLADKDQQYSAAFNDELNAFKDRVERRAKEKIADAMKEIEEEEKQARIGPGGLDPAEVFESLPEVLQKCFESQNIERLKETIASMPEEDARYHMKRCVDSGLWVPDAQTKETIVGTAKGAEGGQDLAEEDFEEVE